MFKIRMGIPEMQSFCDNLKKSVEDGTANRNDMAQYKKLGRAFYHLSIDPFYPGLNTHVFRIQLCSSLGIAGFWSHEL